jgi:hypothetical protein
MMEQVYYLVDV